MAITPVSTSVLLMRSSVGRHVLVMGLMPGDCGPLPPTFCELWFPHNTGMLFRSSGISEWESRGSAHSKHPGSRICCPGHLPIPHPSADCRFITHQVIGGHPKSTGSVPTHPQWGSPKPLQGQFVSTGPTLWSLACPPLPSLLPHACSC